jgi:uncharacterized membrane protein required for colicin V production
MVIDVVLGLAILWGAWGGWRSGFLGMLLSVVILIGAAFVASLFATQAGELLHLGQAFARPVIGFFFLFILLLVAGSLIKRAVKPKSGISKGLDSGLGACLGGLRTALVLSFLLILLRLINLPPDSSTEHSIFYKPVLACSTIFVSVLKPIIPHSLPLIGTSPTK